MHICGRCFKKNTIMSKIGSVTEENEELITSIVSEMGLDNYLMVKPLSITKSKQLIKVQKANATTEYIGKCPDSVFMYVYEAAFDRLDGRAKELLVRDALNSVNYDTEKDKIVMGCPQITVSCDGRAKYGDELVNAAEAGVLAIRQIEEEDKEKK